MKKLFILTFACCLIAFMSPNLHADLILDQSQSDVGSVPIYSPGWLWADLNHNGMSQSFTPGMNNVAGASVSIGLWDSSNDSNRVTVTMKLWDKEPWDGGPKLLVQNSAAVTYNQVVSNGGMVDIYWDPVGVTPGQQYFLQVLTDGPVQQINYVPGDAYPGGTLYFGKNLPQNCEINNGDWVFREYADTTNQAVPEPCTMLLLGCGLVGVVGFRRKHKK